MAHADGFTRYSGAEGAAYAHEAGFDAFMTGSVFACLLDLKRASDATGGSSPALLSRPQRVRPPPSRRPRTHRRRNRTTTYAFVMPCGGTVACVATMHQHLHLGRSTSVGPPWDDIPHKSDSIEVSSLAQYRRFPISTPASSQHCPPLHRRSNATLCPFRHPAALAPERAAVRPAMIVEAQSGDVCAANERFHRGR